MSVFAIGLLIAAWMAETRGLRVFCIVLALANAGTAAKMAHDGYPYAFRMEPQRTPPGIQDEPKPWIPSP